MLHRSARSVLLFFLTAGVVALVTLPSSGSATNFSGLTGATGCTALNMADNSGHSYWYEDLQSENVAATDWTRVNNMDPTDINTSRASSLSSLTDVVVRDRYYVDYCGYDWYSTSSGGIVGLVTCDSLVSGSSRCEQHSMRMSNTFTDNTTTTNVRGLACHENGHTIGLAHRAADAPSCMHQGYPKNALAYDSHDRSHINTNYL